MKKTVNTRNGYVTIEKISGGWHAVNAPYNRLGFYRTRALLIAAINAN